MSKVRTFSSPDEWNCLDKLLEKLPRSVDVSGAVRLSVENFLKTIETKPSVSLDTFADESVTPDLKSEPKIWTNLSKKMDTTELRDLQKLIKKRLAIVEDEIYRRTA